MQNQDDRHIRLLRTNSLNIYAFTCEVESKNIELTRKRNEIETCQIRDQT